MDSICSIVSVSLLGTLCLLGICLACCKCSKPLENRVMPDEVPPDYNIIIHTPPDYQEIAPQMLPIAETELPPLYKPD